MQIPVLQKDGETTLKGIPSQLILNNTGMGPCVVIPDQNAFGGTLFLQGDMLGEIRPSKNEYGEEIEGVFDAEINEDSFSLKVFGEDHDITKEDIAERWREYAHSLYSGNNVYDDYTGQVASAARNVPSYLVKDVKTADEIGHMNGIAPVWKQALSIGVEVEKDGKRYTMPMPLRNVDDVTIKKVEGKSKLDRGSLNRHSSVEIRTDKLMYLAYNENDHDDVALFSIDEIRHYFSEKQAENQPSYLTTQIRPEDIQWGNAEESTVFVPVKTSEGELGVLYMPSERVLDGIVSYLDRDGALEVHPTGGKDYVTLSLQNPAYQMYSAASDKMIMITASEVKAYCDDKMAQSKLDYDKEVVLKKVPEVLFYGSRQKGGMVRIPDPNSRTGFGEVEVAPMAANMYYDKAGCPVNGFLNIKLKQPDDAVKYGFWKSDGRYSKLVPSKDLFMQWERGRDEAFKTAVLDRIEEVPETEINFDREYGL